MENENQNNQTVENTKVEKTGTVDTQTTENQKEGNEQDIKLEAQKIADAMLAKKMKGMPTKEELKAYHDWQETQKTEAQKQSEKEIEYQNALSKNKELEQMLSIRDAGVNKDDVDYVMFKVSRMEGDFEENLNNFLKENPKYLNTVGNAETSETTGFQTRNDVKLNSSSGVTKILKEKYPQLYK